MLEALEQQDSNKRDSSMSSKALEEDSDEVLLNCLLSRRNRFLPMLKQIYEKLAPKFPGSLYQSSYNRWKWTD